MKLKNLFLPLVLLAVMLFGATCWATECPIEVNIKVETRIPFVEIASLVDTVTITDIQLNRGNIKLPSSVILPKTLKFGETTRIWHNNGTIREGTVQTNRGSWTFTFK